MSATPCPRLFEAEAMRDGRLTGAERASFERHVARCPACSSEVRALEALAESLRAEPPDHAVADELHVAPGANPTACRIRSRARSRRSGRGTFGHRLLWPAAVCRARRRDSPRSSACAAAGRAADARIERRRPRGQHVGVVGAQGRATARTSFSSAARSGSTSITHRGKVGSSSCCPTASWRTSGRRSR